MIILVAIPVACTVSKIVAKVSCFLQEWIQKKPYFSVEGLKNKGDENCGEMRQKSVKNAVSGSFRLQENKRKLNPQYHLGRRK